jgi:four helix bundle protein
MQDYHNIRAWRNAIALAMNTRRVVSHFPRAGYSRLKGQMIDSAESIVDNLVEGCGASTQKEFARFLDVSIKSSTELEGQYDLARKYRIVSSEEHSARSTDTIDVRKMLFGLRAKVLASPDRARSDPSRSISNAPRTKRNAATRDACDSPKRRRATFRSPFVQLFDQL